MRGGGVVEAQPEISERQQEKHRRDRKIHRNRRGFDVAAGRARGARLQRSVVTLHARAAQRAFVAGSANVRIGRVAAGARGRHGAKASGVVEHNVVGVGRVVRAVYEVPVSRDLDAVLYGADDRAV